MFITAATVLMLSERFEEAERAYDKAVADARRRGSSVGFAAASSLRSRCTTASAACPRRKPTPTPRSTCATTSRARRATSRSRSTRSCSPASSAASADQELLALVDDFIATQPSEDLPYGLAIHARGWLRAALGDPEGGLEELLACGEREQRWGVGTPQIAPGARRPPRSA